MLVKAEEDALSATVYWGDYSPDEVEGREGKPLSVWRRRPKETTVDVPLQGNPNEPIELPVPESEGLVLSMVLRDVPDLATAGMIPSGTRSASVFLVNRRTPNQDQRDLAYVFQPQLEIRSQEGFVARPDLRGAQAADWDDRVADLHYADTPEYATGHGGSADWDLVTESANWSARLGFPTPRWNAPPLRKSGSGLSTEASVYPRRGVRR